MRPPSRTRKSAIRKRWAMVCLNPWLARIMPNSFSPTDRQNATRFAIHIHRRYAQSGKKSRIKTFLFDNLLNQIQNRYRAFVGNSRICTAKKAHPRIVNAQNVREKSYLARHTTGINSEKQNQRSLLNLAPN